MTESPTHAGSPFVARLRQLAEREDRGALAALRRSLQAEDGLSAAAAPYVLPYLPREASLTRERAFFLVGALFALHPSSGEPGVTLGRAFRRLNDLQEGPGRPDNQSLAGRFAALLDADAEDLPEHLRHAVSLVRSKQIALDWDSVLQAVLHWSHPSRFVQRRLARDFWSPPETVTPQSKEGEGTYEG